MSGIETLECAILAAENIPAPADYPSAVIERAFTATGFTTSFNDKLGPPPRLDDGVYGRTGARLNGSVEAGFIFRVTEGRVDFLEGYTFGDDEWPTKISSFELFPDQRTEVG
jgi:hypothetical protein